MLFVTGGGGVRGDVVRVDLVLGGGCCPRGVLSMGGCFPRVLVRGFLFGRILSGGGGLAQGDIVLLPLTNI